ncbi:hypothetical protein Tco_0469502 [Tanacetum coccineum]
MKSGDAGVKNGILTPGGERKKRIHRIGSSFKLCGSMIEKHFGEEIMGGVMQNLNNVFLRYIKKRHNIRRGRQ